MGASFNMVEVFLPKVRSHSLLYYCRISACMHVHSSLLQNYFRLHSRYIATFINITCTCRSTRDFLYAKIQKEGTPPDYYAIPQLLHLPHTHRQESWQLTTCSFWPHSYSMVHKFWRLVEDLESELQIIVLVDCRNCNIMVLWSIMFAWVTFNCALVPQSSCLQTSVPLH